MLRSSSLKKRELHGIPQFFTVFPPILNSAPMADGIFNCNGHMNPLKMQNRKSCFEYFTLSCWKHYKNYALMFLILARGQFLKNLHIPKSMRVNGSTFGSLMFLVFLINIASNSNVLITFWSWNLCRRGWDVWRYTNFIFAIFRKFRALQRLWPHEVKRFHDFLTNSGTLT